MVKPMRMPNTLRGYYLLRSSILLKMARIFRAKSFGKLKTPEQRRSAAKDAKKTVKTCSSIKEFSLPWRAFD
jgi:hypothetical protein